jgi:hypothetical protein
VPAGPALDIATEDRIDLASSADLARFNLKVIQRRIEVHG